MAGHSKWAQIKRSKGALDVKRGKIFGKFSRAITVAARHGGGDPQFNPRLRQIIQTAKAASMPNDNIDRAIKRAAGGEDGTVIQEVVYEGYGSGGVALLVETMTDNKNRTAADVRNTFNKHHGNMAGAGSVAWMFNRKGVIHIAREAADEEKLLEIVLEAGADDLSAGPEQFEVLTPPDRLDQVLEALKAQGIAAAEAKFAFLPQNTIAVLDEAEARKILELLEALEDLDDVQSVHSNFDIPDAVMEKI
ncbi:MAG: YebC/PmpR family DNA-binding transcriptional regulator [Verrucomicrobiae bacterium]|nr:YebC/PmpR family DNA-binding transcriptional regulator [Verrucomicrobiae bacterium]